MVDVSAQDRTGPGDERAPHASDRSPDAGGPAPSWWARIRGQWWVGALAVYCLGFSALSELEYLPFDPALSRIPIRADVPLHFPLLALHVVTGGVALSLAWLQVWPWLRDGHPRVHRILGRIYFFGGVFPSMVLAYPVAVLTPVGQSQRIALLVLAVLWTTTAVAGFRAAVQGRYADHRRWMLRNVAVTMVIVTSRFLTMLFTASHYWLPSGTYVDQAAVVAVGASASGLYAAMLLHVGFVEWYLLRPRSRRRPPRRAGAASASPA